ncbi:conserved hypothetical protein [Talaromyces stipitatus ATCC 10500]|uniref:Uncharacterized protein n=1 Tax=Talaromyces stipitatus (strain ATCC 10500 / CBS 375.48 / QM 6759 / NRRL 1006) TaxID=441959 RepID=B8MRY6_TALSN|nr:uncharacterized protein TSTA_059100 [Talaromyces stipitatus ATCC 10500]EED13422.1 conserved hypothetical protein [Talaromyces stipitatus ATCC 10500]
MIQHPSREREAMDLGYSFGVYDANTGFLYDADLAGHVVLDISGHYSPERGYQRSHSISTNVGQTSFSRDTGNSWRKTLDWLPDYSGLVERRNEQMCTGTVRPSVIIGPDESATGMVSTSPRVRILSDTLSEVQKYWSIKPRRKTCFMRHLWRDMALDPGNDCSDMVTTTENEIENYNDWRIPDNCMLRMKEMWQDITRHRRHALSSASQCPNFGDRFTILDFSHTPLEYSKRVEYHKTRKFHELLNLGLDLYLQKFYHLMPMIHLSTFRLADESTLLVFLMCTLGLTFANTEEASTFVHDTFEGILERVILEVSDNSFDNATSTGKMQLWLILVHVLALIIVTGVSEHLLTPFPTERLEACQLNVSQKYGLFSVECAEDYDMARVWSISDKSKQWRTWARVESTKRIVIGLILADAWFSEFFSTDPIIRTYNIHLFVLSDRKSFEARSAKEWAQLRNDCRESSSGRAVFLSSDIQLPVLCKKVDPFFIHGLLSLTLLRVYHDYERLLLDDILTQHYSIPWKAVATDQQAQKTTGLVTQIMRLYGDVLEYGDPNTMVFWHYICILETCDIRLLELGAGRNGDAYARQAVRELSLWSRTPAARRACLHAAQIFSIISQQRRLDSIMFLSVYALFVAALTLGFFFLSLPPDIDTLDEPLDLLDNVDWKRIAEDGISEACLTERTDDSAVNFVRFGNMILMGGEQYHGGFRYSRRALQDFAILWMKPLTAIMEITHSCCVP